MCEYCVNNKDVVVGDTVITREGQEVLIERVGKKTNQWGVEVDGSPYTEYWGKVVNNENDRSWCFHCYDVVDIKQEGERCNARI